MHRLDTCLNWILKAEGGLVDDPNDMGGITKYGISQAAYPDLDVEALTIADARIIYERDYWLPCRCGDLPDGLDLVVLDSAVLMGVHASIVQLQRALKVKADGIIGYQTLGIATTKGIGALPSLLTERMLYLTQARTWKHHGRGWTLRTMRLAQEVF